MKTVSYCLLLICVGLAVSVGAQTAKRRPAVRKAVPAATAKPVATATPEPVVTPAPTTVATPPTVTPVAPVGVKPPSAKANDKDARKANVRPVPAPTPAPEPFANATVAQMAGQCVTLDTEAGAIRFEVFPEHAPVTVRSFLNLVASGALDTTTFSRVVKGFVIQGGNLSTSARWDYKLAARAGRTLPDEPNPVKHERGIVSMARPEEPNQASTHFFILLSTATSLDGTFAAFGRVLEGMDAVEKINAASVIGEKPDKPVVINRASVAACPPANK